MTVADISFSTLVTVVMGILAIGNLLIMLNSPVKAVGKRVDDQNARLDAHDLRLAALEQGQKQLPSSKDLHELELAMADLKGEMKEMSAVIRGQSDIMQRLESIVSRHEQHLLQGKL